MKFLPTLLVVTILHPGAAIVPDDVDCYKDLRKARELIEERWSFKLFKVGGFDLEESFKKLEPRAKRAKTPRACADVLARFMSDLNDGHSSLQSFPDLEWTKPEIEIRSQRERLSRVPGRAPPLHAYVFSRDTTDETLKTILPGTEILAVDGEPVDSLYAYLDDRVSGSTSWWRDYMCDRRLLIGPAGTEVELKIREPGGRVKTVTVKRPPWPSEEEREREREIYRDTATVAASRYLEDGWGYLRFTTFSFERPDRTVKRFDEALDSVFDAPGLIIDLRGNGGGYVAAMQETAGRFIDEEVALHYLQVREPGQEKVVELWDPTTGSYTTKPPIISKPRKPTYQKPLVILIDRRCFSACEGFTGGLQSIGRALVVGPSPSGGGSGYVSGLRLPSGAIISFSWTVAWRPDGQQIEGNGVAPDIKVRLRPRTDWPSGRDRVLERAIKALEQGEAPGLVAASEDT